MSAMAEPVPLPSAFNLRQTVRMVLDESSNPDPKALADEVLDLIPPDEERACLLVLLRSYIRNVSNGQRTRRYEQPTPPDGSQPRSSRWADTARFSHQIRVWRVFITLDDWKFLGDLTSDDCLGVARMYGDLAAANEKRAKQYQVLCEAIVEAGVATAGELADELLMDIFE